MKSTILHSKIMGEGFPLLVLHGLFGMGDNWVTLGRKFAEHFQVHLIDLRNHGRSFHHEVMNYEVMSEDIIEYCQFHKLNKIHLLGHSMGGKIAMFLSVQYPVLIEKLVIADIAPKSYDDRHFTLFDALQQVDFKTLKTREDVKLKLSEFVKNERILQFLLKNVYHQNSEFLDFRFNLDFLKKNYHLLNESLPVYSQFNGKILFLKGSLSDYILKNDEKAIYAHFPHAEIAEISGAGHWLHAENPDEFYLKSMSFLNQFIEK